MLNPDLLRHHTESVAKRLSKRNFVLDIKKIILMEKQRKLLQIKTENLKYKHNILSKIIGQKKRIDLDISDLKNEANIIIEKLNIVQKKLNVLVQDIYMFSMNIPNIPDISSIPTGINENKNMEISRWGEIKQYNFKIKDHVELGNQLNGFDWKSSAKMSGSRFTIMKGSIALLYRALGQFMMDIHTNQHHYLETYVPYLVNKHNLYGTGQLPKFSMDLFYAKKISDESLNEEFNYVLIPTAEVPLTNLFRDCILKKKQLPIKLVANTPCFRSETLSYGRDTRGLIRLHQFDKVELFQIVHPNHSMDKLEELTCHAEYILKLLNLPYRKLLLCAKDLGFSSSKTYDLEVWFPSQNTYREVSSCSNMLDFQTRRIKARFRCEQSNKNYFAHTINGSGLAIGRTLAAILENYQQDNGKIKIPKILRYNYMKGLKFIE